MSLNCKPPDQPFTFLEPQSPLIDGSAQHKARLSPNIEMVGRTNHVRLILDFRAVLYFLGKRFNDGTTDLGTG